MKIRYSLQRRKYDCGSCVIINCIKFYGYKTSYTKELISLNDILSVDRYGGTYPDIMKEVISDSDFPYYISKVRNNVKLKDLKVHIKTGNPVMLFYSNHVALVTEIKNNKITLINHSKNATVNKVDYKKFKKLYMIDKAFFIKEKYET